MNGECKIRHCRGRIRVLILCWGVALSGMLPAGAARAGPILALYAEEFDAYGALVQHGPINDSGIHTLIRRVRPPLMELWSVRITITEFDGRGLVADSIIVDVKSQHLVGVPGHVDEPGNRLGVGYGLGSGLPPYQPGNNTNVKHLPPLVIPHDPLLKPDLSPHTDTFFATLTFSAAADRLNILDYRLDLVGVHCDDCPVPPTPDGPGLTEATPEPSSLALALAGLGVCSLLAAGVRRRDRGRALEHTS